jgi:hypothetical protein
MRLPSRYGVGKSWRFFAIIDVEIIDAYAYMHTRFSRRVAESPLFDAARRAA